MSLLHFPGESTDYRTARNRLLGREIELRRLAEEVARERRALPLGGKLPSDYEVVEADVRGGTRKLRFSELFGDKPTLAAYSYMFGPEKKEPCRMCTPLLDGLDGAGDHIRQRLAFVIVSESPAERLAAWMKERGWRNARLVSVAGTGYNRDYHGKDGEGNDTTMLNVFKKVNGAVHHFWSTELAHGPSDPGQDHRGLDLLSPIYQMFDMTPEGRGDWYTNLRY
jgi:predicted dithiol-disulfide oxidoreductase (DUF899 family)